MTLKSWFFKLQQEDLKRRLWAIALLFLACFFVLPVGLAITMENAAATNYYRYNDWEPLVNDGTFLTEQFEAILVRAKVEAAMEHIRFGNGMLVFLLVTASIVMGISSFSYLHNKKKVDFYHSIPVRREKLFLVQFITLYWRLWWRLFMEFMGTGWFRQHLQASASICCITA